MPTMAGMAEMRAHLNHFLRRLRAGEAVVISDHGHPIGWIAPYGEKAEEKPERLERLVAWSGKELPGHAPVARARGGGTVAELLVEERA